MKGMPAVFAQLNGRELAEKDAKREELIRHMRSAKRKDMT